MKVIAYQKGVTLITTLIVLILVTVIGTVAVRYAMTGLKISTNSQVKQLLNQSADTPFYIIRNMAPQDIRRLDNVIGLALKNGLPNQEYVFCYRPKSQRSFAQLTSFAVISPYDTTGKLLTGDTMRLIQGNNSNFCSLTEDYGSARDGVVTQVAVKLISTASGNVEKGQFLPEGTDVSGGSFIGQNFIGNFRFRVTTTAMLPSYANTSLATIQSECLSASKPRLNDNIDTPNLKTLTDCVRSYGVAAETQTQEFNLASDFIEVSKPDS